MQTAIINYSDENDNEYEIEIEGTIAPAERDVGIMSAYLDEWYVVNITDLETNETLHPDNWNGIDKKVTKSQAKEAIFEAANDAYEGARDAYYERKMEEQRGN